MIVPLRATLHRASLIALVAVSTAAVSAQGGTTACQVNLTATYALGYSEAGRWGVEIYSGTNRQSGWLTSKTRPGPNSVLDERRYPKSPITDCSSAAYLCVEIPSLGDIYSVPRSRMTPSANFQFAGRTYSTLGCFGPRCQEFVIVSELPCNADCTKRRDSVGGFEHVSRIAFIYSETHGIEAYKALKEGEKLDSRDTAQITTQFLRDSGWMILSGEKGLLVCK